MNKILDTEKRIENLEIRIKKIENLLTSQNLQMNERASEPLESKMALDNASQEKPSESVVWDSFVTWIKTDWLMKLGAFLLILALGWFVTYAFVNNWVGPTGRIAIGILAGAALMAFGHLSISKREVPGKVLIITGGVMILMTLFAARAYYDFITPAMALAMMFLTVAAMATLAIIHNTQSMAMIALIGGALVPILINAPQTDNVKPLTYILIVVIGAGIVTAIRGWRPLILASLIISAIYSFALFGGTPQSIVWLFMGLFFGLYFIAINSAILHNRFSPESDLAASALNGVLLLTWVYRYVPHESASLVLSGIILLLVILEYLLLQKEKTENAVFTNAGLAILFLGAATAFELKGEVLTIAYSIEALILVALSAVVFRLPKLANGLAWLQIIPMLMAFSSLSSKDWQSQNLFSQSFFVLLIVILSLAGTAVLLKKFENGDKEAIFLLPSIVCASLYSISLIWLSSHILFESVNMARAIALIIYSIAGVTLVFSGSTLNKSNLRLGGGLLLGAVVLRLLFVEIWKMALGGRIVTFVIIGLLLVSTAYFQKSLKK